MERLRTLFSHDERLAMAKILFELAFIDKSVVTDKTYSFITAIIHEIQLQDQDLQSALQMRLPEDLEVLKNKDEIKKVLPTYMYQIVCSENAEQISPIRIKLFNAFLSMLEIEGKFDDWH
jgi:hypothetical protein